MDAEDEIPEPTPEIVSLQPSVERRKLFRKLAALAGLGITGALLSQDKVFLPQVKGANGDSVVIGNTNTGTAQTELTSSVSGESAFAAINSDTTDHFGVGLYGESDSPLGIGVKGIATGGVLSISILGVAGNSGTVPLVAQGASGQEVDLQQWQDSSGNVLSKVIGVGVAPAGTIVAPQLGQTSPNFNYAAPGNPSSFTNQVAAGYLADGLAIPFTPKLTGNVLIFASVDLYNTGGAFTFGQIWYGLGPPFGSSAPSFGATLPSGAVAISPGRGNINASGTLFAIQTGLVTNAAYWFDLGHGINGGTGTHNNIA